MSRPVNHRRYWTAFLLTIAGLIYLIKWHVTITIDQVRREAASSLVTESVTAVFVDHLDIETGLRGYLLENNREYLRPYHEGVSRIVADLPMLVARTADHPREAEACGRLVALSRTIRAEFTAQVEMVDTAGVNAARRRFSAYPTKPTMDRIRDQLASISAFDQSVIQTQRNRLERSSDTTISVCNVSFWTVVIIVVVLWIGLTPPGWEVDRHAAP